jgi:hypothetical protein
MGRVLLVLGCVFAMAIGLGCFALLMMSHAPSAALTVDAGPSIEVAASADTDPDPDPDPTSEPTVDSVPDAAAPSASPSPPSGSHHGGRGRKRHHKR